jgi:hypothetical protein
MRLSLGTSYASDDRRLIAILGEYALPYMLPPNTLVLLENPPIDPRPERPLLLEPNPCWFGRIALGMKINDRS